MIITILGAVPLSLLNGSPPFGARLPRDPVASIVTAFLGSVERRVAAAPVWVTADAGIVTENHFHPM